ncbi:MAG: CBS domain-containing protein, partial [Sinomicrobium sp.]|nr:CBS domain-containing protein [Sinomicrobium sp.]
GRELWSETRIALFTQSVDTRKSTFILNEKEARVGFGRGWVSGSVADIFKDNILQFRSLITSDFDVDSLTELKSGTIPKLRALNLHNGTVYRWNRPCYGVGGGKPHLRIENRYIPSGPSTSDEIANLMFWVGIMRGRPKKYDALHDRMDFKDIKTNFFNAARYGMATQFYWDGKLVSSHDLILDELLPMAYRGLYSMHVKPEDAEHYLTIIENRVKTRTGSRWMVQSYRNLSKNYKNLDAMRILTAAMYRNQEKGYPVSTWEVVRAHTEIVLKKEKTVAQYMNTRVFTVGEKDSAELALTMMRWKAIHHVPVINNDSELVGLLTWTDVKTYLDHPEKISETVGRIMRTDVITCTSDTGIETAKQRMEHHKINCLPVVKGSKLIGIITTKDY